MPETQELLTAKFEVFDDIIEEDEELEEAVNIN